MDAIHFIVRFSVMLQRLHNPLYTAPHTENQEKLFKSDYYV